MLRRLQSRMTRTNPGGLLVVLAVAALLVMGLALAVTAQEPSYPPLAVQPDPSFPLDNPYSPEKAELGRMLFFDARMSGDGSISCNSCHPSGSGWAAPAPISFGGPGTSHWRNSQSILNVAFYTKLNWDGARGSIEKQNSGAWGGAVAGNLDSALAEERLAQIPGYVERFRDVYGTDYPLWDDALKALATYQRTIVSQNVPFDNYLNGDTAALSEAALRGLEIFEGKANCIACHNGPLISDDSYHNTGVPQNPDFFDSPLKQITFRYEQVAKGASEKLYRTTQEDLGLYYVTKQDSDKAKFRTPNLRDVCYTAPYMHNGVFQTLEEVVAFYNGGGGDHPNKDPRLTALDLSSDEQADLVAFLQSLCGDPVTDESPELPPYGVMPGPKGE